MLRLFHKFRSMYLPNTERKTNCYLKKDNVKSHKEHSIKNQGLGSGNLSSFLCYSSVYRTKCSFFNET